VSERPTSPVFTPKPFRIRRSEKCVRKSFVIRTSESLDLKFFRIRTCEKNLFFCLLRLTKHPKRMFILLALSFEGSERSESKDLAPTIATKDLSAHPTEIVCRELPIALLALSLPALTAARQAQLACCKQGRPRREREPKHLGLMLNRVE